MRRRSRRFWLAKCRACFSAPCNLTACGFANRRALDPRSRKPTPNVIIADCTDLIDKTRRPERLLNIGKEQRDAIEHVVAAKVAKELMDRLPRTPAEFFAFVERGYELATHMSWDAVCENYIVPGIERACRAKKLAKIA